MEEHQDRIHDWHVFRQEAYHWRKKLPCLDPRYGKIVDVETGEELQVRHSSGLGGHTMIVLKRVRNRRVACVLADYDRRSLDGFCYACIAADKELARMAGLLI